MAPGEAVKVFEMGGRRYTVRVGWHEPDRFEVGFRALRGGKPYGPAFARLKETFETVDAAVTAAEAHAKKVGPYKPSGRYAEKHGFAGKPEGDWGGYEYEITAKHREWLDHLLALFPPAGGKLLTPATKLAADVNAETVAKQQEEIRRLEGEAAQLRITLNKQIDEYEQLEDELHNARLTRDQNKRVLTAVANWFVKDRNGAEVFPGMVEQLQRVPAELVSLVRQHANGVCSVCRSRHGTEVIHEAE